MTRNPASHTVNNHNNSRESIIKSQSLTAEDVQLVTSQIKAVLESVKSLREYLEQTGKLQASDRNRFQAAEITLQTIKVKTTISRASEMTKRINQAKLGKF